MDKLDKLSMQTTNIVDENIKRIGELFPNCLTERLDENGRPETAIDFDQLRQELSKSIVEGPEERYQFSWPDKRNAIRLANAPTTDTLRPCREESVDFDTTQNLYIEGDNLQVLKLLRENYLGKVKMIYIDPPYNTGNDFVYNDDFAQSAGEYIHNSGQEDEEGNRLVANTESNGRFHTDWLNMIYPRLKVAKDLLSEDGMIFISIDDNEIENLTKVCNEIFGERNFLTCVTRGTGTPTGGGFDGLVNELDYILIYARNIMSATINGLEMSDDDAQIYDQEDEFGRYLIRPLRRTGGEDRREDRPTMYYPLEAPDGTLVYPKGPTGYDSRWICGESKYKELVASNLIAWKQVEQNGSRKWNVYQKFYLEGRLKAPGNLWSDIEGNKKATRDVRSLFDTKKVFDFPKPIGVLTKCISIGADKDSIILDFFSGSATTSEAVMRINQSDGGNRKFIMVQLPEATDEKSEAYKAGFKNICEIGKERIRRAGKKILEEQQAKQADLFSGEQKPLDIGFRVLKLDSSNMQDVYYSPEQFNENLLFEDNIKPDRTEEDLLFQAMIELGIELSAKIEKQELAGKTVWSVANGYLMACFDTDVNETTITEIARQKPYYFVMRDSSLATDNVADNFEQIWEEYSKETIRRII
ncbi:MAG: site-specific DNA-methyltransferase [Bacteroidales bacterium]|nr:site-specific DNA-methyltransferase [Bacteroidales bacterium]